MFLAAASPTNLSWTSRSANSLGTGSVDRAMFSLAVNERSVSNSLYWGIFIEYFYFSGQRSSCQEVVLEEVAGSHCIVSMGGRELLSLPRLQ